MTQLERADLHAAIETRYPDNTSEDITPLRLRQGLHELVDSVFVTATDTGAVPNVPLYVPGTFYVVGYTVRHTPLGGQEGFYAAKNAGKLTAPGPGNLIDWKVVPGPVLPTDLSQSLTLSQAQGLDQAGVVAGRAYLIDCGLDANGNQQTLTVRGLANEFFDTEGTLEVNGVRTAITDFKVQAGTWTVVGPTGYTKAEVDTKLKRYQCALVFQHADPLVGPDFHEVAATITRVALNPQATGLGISVDGGSTYTNLAFTANVWTGTLAVPAGSSVFYQLTFATGQDAAGAIITTLDA